MSFPWVTAGIPALLLVAGASVLLLPDADREARLAGAAGGDGPWIEVYHFASDVVQTVDEDGTRSYPYREIFRVWDVRGDAVPIANVTVRRDGAPFPVAWTDLDGDGLVGVDDTFAFVEEAFDQKRTLRGYVGDDLVLECMYGGGAGHPAEPEDLRPAGLLRCLENKEI
jgi:hypothetical protein